MIYALHVMLISLFMTKWCDIIHPVTGLSQIVIWILVVTSCILTCVLFDWVTKRFLPKFNSILTGGR